MKKVGLACVLVVAAAAPLLAQRRPLPMPPTLGGNQDVGGRAKAAEKVVVATIVSVTPTFEINRFGDRLIVSHAELRVEEALKGAPASVVELDVEGGTIGDLTLTVSDMPTLTPGERGVFFLREAKPGVHVPHDRVNSIMKLDRSDRIRGTTLTLGDVKMQVQRSTLR
jgi:hypothetical protein